MWHVQFVLSQTLPIKIFFQNTVIGTSQEFKSSEDPRDMNPESNNGDSLIRWFGFRQLKVVIGSVSHYPNLNIYIVSFVVIKIIPYDCFFLN